MIIAFSDLDDTLFSSPRSYESVDSLAVAATLSNGKASAYASHAQSSLFSMISAACVVIPVTGRRLESLNRVSYPFYGDKVASHGAIIVDSKNNLHPEWKLVLDTEAKLWAPKIAALYTAVCEFIDKIGLTLRVRVVEDFGYPCYLCVKGGVEDLREITSNSVAPLGKEFFVHTSDRNIAFLPAYASKQRAVVYLKNKYQRESKTSYMYLGLGDSISDLPFMSECDFQIMPSSSQILKINK
jgi:hypothetical protein